MEACGFWGHGYAVASKGKAEGHGQDGGRHALHPAVAQWLNQGTDLAENRFQHRHRGRSGGSYTITSPGATQGCLQTWGQGVWAAGHGTGLSARSRCKTQFSSYCLIIVTLVWLTVHPHRRLGLYMGWNKYPLCKQTPQCFSVLLCNM